MACSLVVEEVSSVMIVSSLLAAKHDCVSQSRGPQWFPLSVGRHGRTAVHAAIGEGGTDGWHEVNKKKCKMKSEICFLNPRYYATWGGKI